MIEPSLVIAVLSPKKKDKQTMNEKKTTLQSKRSEVKLRILIKSMMISFFIQRICIHDL